MKYPIQVLFREYFEGILAAIILALFLRFFVLNILYMPSDNMNPGMRRGDFVLGWRLSYGFPLPLMKGERLNFKGPQHGDVISFRFPGDEEQIIIRRVIGLPGDRIAIAKGVVIRNGSPLEQVESSEGAVEERGASKVRYTILPNLQAKMQELVVPEDALFVLSDNRMKLDDSRDWGFVPFLNVESQVGMIWLSVASEPEGTKVLWERIFNWVQ